MYSQRFWIERGCCDAHAIQAIESSAHAEVVQWMYDPGMDTRTTVSVIAWLEPFPSVVPRMRDSEPIDPA